MVIDSRTRAHHTWQRCADCVGAWCRLYAASSWGKLHARRRQSSDSGRRHRPRPTRTIYNITVWTSESICGEFVITVDSDFVFEQL